jgi:tetratricopeptide (TPR) repeat protein
MTEEEEDELLCAMGEARDMPESLAKVEALEELVRRATQMASFENVFRTYLYLLNAAHSMVLPERMLAAYAGLRATFEEHGHDFPPGFDKYVPRAGAMLLGFLDSFPEIARAEIDALFAEQERIHVRYGESPCKLLEAQVWLELDAGNHDRASALYERLLAIDDYTGWCEPCRLNQRVSILVTLRRDDEALAAAAPLLDGRGKCDTVPKSTWKVLLLPLARRGELDRARGYYARAHRAVLADPRWIGDAARVLTFAAIDRSLAKGKNLLERCLPRAFEPVPKDSIRDFFVAAMVYFEAVGRERKTIKLATPKQFPLHAAGGSYEVAALRAWFEQSARSLAQAFDRRNGNDYQSRRIDKACDVLGLA